MMNIVLIILMMVTGTAAVAAHRRDSMYVHGIDCIGIARRLSLAVLFVITCLLFKSYMLYFLMAGFAAGMFVFASKTQLRRRSPMLANVWCAVCAVGLIMLSIVHVVQAIQQPKASYITQGNSNSEDGRLATLVAKDLSTRMDSGNVVVIMPSADPGTQRHIADTFASHFERKPGLSMTAIQPGPPPAPAATVGPGPTGLSAEERAQIERTFTDGRTYPADVAPPPISETEHVSTTLESGFESVIDTVNEHQDADVVVVWSSLQGDLTAEGYAQLKKSAQSKLYVVRPQDEKLTTALMERGIVTGMVVADKHEPSGFRVLTPDIAATP